MEKGFLENIIDMFKHDASLYTYIGELMRDERLIVRIGLSALIETLSKEDPENIIMGIPSILPLLKEQNSVLRSDAAYFLGMIGHKDALPYLRAAMHDEDETVRTIAKESIEEIQFIS
jgi:HEAT repeat protein